MDNFVIRWYNQNRKMIWIVILTIVGIIALIQSLNNYYKNNPEDKSSSTTISTTTYNTPSNYSVVTKEEINENVSNKSIDLIDDFFKYCNEEQIEYAYNLLSTECKQELYPVIEDFKTKYYNKIFTEQKNYESTLWITTSGKHTYRIEIFEDALATGVKKFAALEDYYTIVYENGKYRLNINGFIGKEEINKSNFKSNAIVNVISKKMYIDYEIYEIEIQNNTGSKLIFNTKENTDSIYLLDGNEIKYIAFLNEIPDSELEILNGLTKTLQIKFNRGYKPTIDIEKIVFENINNKGKIENIEIELK